MESSSYKKSAPGTASEKVVAAEFVVAPEPHVTLDTSPSKLDNPEASNTLRRLGFIFISTVAFVIIVVVVYLTVLKKHPADMSLASNENDLGNDIHIFKRDQWDGRAIRDGYRNRTLVHPINLVIIGHTASVNRCMTFETCAHYMQVVQNDHVNDFDYIDIKYNFLIGGDGNIYEALGWDIQNYIRNNSIHISFVGNYLHDQVLDRQRIAVQALLNHGVELGKLDMDYWLIAHSQVANTQSPGTNLLSAMKLWPHYYNAIFT